MVFENIFAGAQAGASTAHSVEEDLEHYLASEPAEHHALPPHDPAQAPPQKWLGDPTLVRQSRPELAPVLSLITAFGGTIIQVSEKEAPVANSPAATSDPAASVMGAGEDAARKSTENLPQPSVGHRTPLPDLPAQKTPTA